MKFDFTELHNRRHILAWIIAESVGQNFRLFHDMDSTSIDVLVTVNGVDVDVRELFDNLEKAINESEKITFEKGKKEGIEDVKDRLIEKFEQMFGSDET
jgi:hypothetical protein